MSWFFAQEAVSAAATATGAVGSLLSGRSDAMVILVLSLLVAGFWLWKIHLPRQESVRMLQEADKTIHATNALTLAELGKVTAGVSTTTIESNKTLRAMVEVKQIELDCLAVVADAAKCDVREKLAEARGVLRAVTAGATGS